MRFLKINVHFKLVKHLNQGDLEGFGRLMNASHVSLEHDYEVTGLELDTLAHSSMGTSKKGVLGARMTGRAGFGGCAIALVNKDKVEDFKKQLVNVMKKSLVMHQASISLK